MNALLILPVILPFAAAAAALFFRGNPARQHQIGSLAALLHLAACTALFVGVYRGGIQTLQVGGWPPPFGITLAADHLSVVMVIVTAVLGLAVTFYSR